MSPDADSTVESPDNRRFRYGVLAVAGGAVSMGLLWLLPGHLLLAEVATALLALVLLVGGTLAVGTSAPHRAA